MNSTTESPDSPHKPITLEDILDAVQEISERCAMAQRSLYGVLGPEPQK